ncbi:MAG TPA: lytic transglycosylase domain-containing protein [Stellaceae bacterium]|nr:lytic transglycosylase domain-containing protein [Stellaceae bacterium]
MRVGRGCRWLALLALALAAPAPPAAADDRQAICQTIADAAAADGLPMGFLARLLWTESGFRSTARSPAGAEGVAQFMPQTAAERGLRDPTDPFQAIRHAAALLVELEGRFGNLGLAAAAYNAGPARVAKWLQGLATLPVETRLYVLAITGRPPEDWASPRVALYPASYPLPGLDCLNATATAARREPAAEALPVPALEARLDGHLAAAIALFGALSRSEVAAVKPAWHGRQKAADSLCAMFRAEGASCEVVGR